MKTRSALTVSALAALITLGACGANNSTTVSNPSTSAPGATSTTTAQVATSASQPASTDSTTTTVASQAPVTVDPKALATLDQTVTQINTELAATDADLSSADSAIARGD